MRAIRRTGKFKRDFKRELKGPYAQVLAAELPALLRELTSDQPLEAARRDHPLTGEWKDHRDCHVRPDLVLIYRKPDNETLELVRLGSHSELGL
jgi:mRNA interferase YafQ